MAGSGAPRHGCMFKELSMGTVQSYATDALIDITRITKDGHTRTPTIREAEDMLLTHIDGCLRTIIADRQRPVERFYIGKTHVGQLRDRQFNHMSSSSWKLDGGINGRCSDHIRAGHGRDGLVVLTVVTADAIHAETRNNKPRFNHEEYASALLCRLVQDCMTDSRLHNERAELGTRRDTAMAIGYPLYMSFKVSLICTRQYFS